MVGAAGSGEVADGAPLALVAALDLHACIRQGAQDLATVVALLGHPGRGELGGGVGLVAGVRAGVALDRRGGAVGRVRFGL